MLLILHCILFGAYFTFCVLYLELGAENVNLLPHDNADKEEINGILLEMYMVKRGGDDGVKADGGNLVLKMNTLAT